MEVHNYHQIKDDPEAELEVNDAVSMPQEDDQSAETNNGGTETNEESGKVKVIVRGGERESDGTIANIGDIVVKEEPEDIIVKIIVPDEEDASDSAMEEGERRIGGELGANGVQQRGVCLTVIKHCPSKVDAITWGGAEALSSSWKGYSEAVQRMARVMRPKPMGETVIPRNAVKQTVAGATAFPGYSSAVHRMGDTKTTAHIRALMMAREEAAKNAAAATVVGSSSTSANEGPPTVQGKPTDDPKKCTENLSTNDTRLYDAIRAAMADPLPNRDTQAAYPKAPQSYSLLADPRLDDVIRTALSGGAETPNNMPPATAEKEAEKQPDEEKERTETVSDGPCLCDICGKTFRNSTSLRMHKKRHETEKPYACIYCEMAFYRKSELYEHKRKHTGEKPYVCEKCGLAFSRKNGLTIHQRVHSGEEPHKCDVCGKSFAWRNLLVIHERTHTGERPFECSFCGRTFARKPSLDVHVVEKHTGRRYPCGRCEESFSLRAQLNTHMRTLHKEYYHCDDCGELTRSPKNLWQHWMKNHAGGKMFQCEVCGKVFVNKTTLHQHVNVHSGARPFSCDVCDKTFSRRGCLTTHRIVHTKENSHICDICGRGFKTPTYLSLHQRGHAEESLHRCTICGRGFTFPYRLQRHMIWHSADRPHKCELCGMSFHIANGLDRHIRRVHEKEKPFQCDDCGKAFFRQTTLRLHSRVHTGEKPYSCDICGRAFSQKYNVTVHMKVHRDSSCLDSADEATPEAQDRREDSGNSA